MIYIKFVNNIKTVFWGPGLAHRGVSWGKNPLTMENGLDHKIKHIQIKKIILLINFFINTCCLKTTKHMGFISNSNK